MIQVKIVSTTHSEHSALIPKHEAEVNGAIQMLDQMGMCVCSVEPTQMRVNSQALNISSILCYEPKSEEETKEKY